MPSLNFDSIIQNSVGGLGQVGAGLYQGVGAEGAIGGGRLGNASQLALGRIDTQAFLAAHPEFAEPYNNVKASGQDPSQWLELAIQDATYIDPASVPRGGGVADTVGGLTNVASGLETGANTAVRTGNLSDVTTLGKGYSDAYRASNPELFATLGGASALGGATPYQPFSAQGYNAATYSPMANLTADQLQQGMLGGSLYGQAMQAGPNAASQALLGRATAFANSNGALTANELRNVQQGTREAFAARGLEMSNPAIAAEIGNRIGAERSRMTEDLSLAAQLGNAYNQDLAASRGFATGVYGQELGRQGANQGANLQAGMANQGAYNQAGQFNAASQNQAMQFTAQQQNAAALANSQLAQQQQQQDRGYALNLAGSYQNAAYDPTRLLGATSGAPAMAGGLLGAATGYSPDLGSYFGQTSGIANDVAMTRYNAEMAAQNAAKNRSSGLLGGALGAIGTIGGALLGVPSIGAAVGSGLGSIFGGGGGGAGAAPASFNYSVGSTNTNLLGISQPTNLPSYMQARSVSNGPAFAAGSDPFDDGNNASRQAFVTSVYGPR